jgi:hypothetical protein
MSLVLVGANSYSVVYVDEEGVERRAMVKKGQTIDGLPLSDSELEELKSAFLLNGNTPVPVFVELEHAPGHPSRHMQAGTIGNHAIKEQKAAAEAELGTAPEAPVEVPVESPSVVVIEAVVEEVVEEVPAEVAVEAPVEEKAPKAPTQAKKAKKSKK